MIGNIISAGASILGGFMNRASHKDAQAQTAYFADKNMRMQEEFAQNGIRWRVNDARKAGIHPLYALGASVPSYTPSSVSFAGDSSLGNSFAQAGQDIGRAINSTRTASERVDAFAKSMQAIQLENAGLDTEIKRAQLAAMIAKNRDNATPPGPGGDVRSLQIFEGENPVTTPKSEVQQQKVSDEYGDEGLASIHFSELYIAFSPCLSDHVTVCTATTPNCTPSGVCSGLTSNTCWESEKYRMIMGPERCITVFPTSVESDP